MSLGEVMAAAAARLGEHAGGVLDRVRGGSKVAIDRAARARTMAAWRAPVPPNLRAIHPSWIAAALAGLPARARQAVAGDASAPVDVWLARWACAAFPPMPAPALARPEAPDDVAALLDPLAWLVEVGLDQLAFALASAGTDTATIGRLGAPMTRAFERIQLAPRAGNLGPARAAVARCRVPDDDLRYARIGARALAPHADALAGRRLVLRLDRTVGLAVEAELRAHGGEARAQAPAWAALSA